MFRLLPLLLLGCAPAEGTLEVKSTPNTGKPPLGTGLPTQPTGDDQDGDGWTVQAGDCDDEDAGIFPGATEILGDGIDNDCRGGVYANPTAYFEVTPTDAADDVATATVVVSLYDHESEFLCYLLYTVNGLAGTGPGQVPDCPSCNAWLALEFNAAGRIPVTEDPDACGNEVLVEDPQWLGPATGDYWFGGMAFVDLDTMRSENITLWDWTADDLATELQPWAATHVGAIRADALTNTPMTSDDEWEAGAWVAVDPIQNPNTGPTLSGQYTASAIYLLDLGD